MILCRRLPEVKFGPHNVCLCRFRRKHLILNDLILLTVKMQENTVFLDKGIMIKLFFLHEPSLWHDHGLKFDQPKDKLTTKRLQTSPFLRRAKFECLTNFQGSADTKTQLPIQLTASVAFKLHKHVRKQLQLWEKFNQTKFCVMSSIWAVTINHYRLHDGETKKTSFAWRLRVRGILGPLFRGSSLLIPLLYFSGKHGSHPWLLFQLKALKQRLSPQAPLMRRLMCVKPASPLRWETALLAF